MKIMKIKKLITSIMLLGILTGCNYGPRLNRLTTPKIEKVSLDLLNKQMSLKSFNSYNAFAKKFSYLMLTANNSDVEKSMAVSIPDAYICFALTAAISTDEARSDILNYLELTNMEELKVTTKEIIMCLGTLYEGEDGEISGGYNLNSAWFDPEQVTLLPKDKQLYKDLEEIFDASLYNEGLTSEKAKKYLKDNGLKGLPIPDINLEDSPAAISVMSVYYAIDRFSAETTDFYRSQFASNNHLMDYIINGVTSKQNYIERQSQNYVYEGDNFHGTNLSIDNLIASFFLPDEQTVMPSAILEDVIEDNYAYKEGVATTSSSNTQFATRLFDVTLKAPYFKIDNDLSLSENNLKGILPHITERGAGERIAKSNTGYALYLSDIKQFSTMKFDYEGFYSCSATVALMKATSGEPMQLEEYNLTLDHPYAFKITKGVSIPGDSYTFGTLPIVIGEIVDPGYSS